MNIDTPAAAQALDEAARKAEPTAQLTQLGQLDTAQAYEIQAALMKHRQDRGERIVGAKMGFTSHAKMAQMGISDMIFGQLTDGMHVENGATIDMARFLHPRAEPEIAFLLKGDLGGEVSRGQALEAVSGVAAAVEIIDSRYRNFKFALTDVIADNSSSSAFVVGDWCELPDDLSDLSMIFEVGDARDELSSSAILGDPVLSLMACSRLLGQYGRTLPAGSIVLAGAGGAAVALQSGVKVRLAVERLGGVSFSVR